MARTQKVFPLGTFPNRLCAAFAAHYAKGIHERVVVHPPAWELFGGATSAEADAAIDEVRGVHCLPRLPLGLIACKPLAQDATRWHSADASNHGLPRPPQIAAPLGQTRASIKEQAKEYVTDAVEGLDLLDPNPQPGAAARAPAVQRSPGSALDALAAAAASASAAEW